MQVRGGGKGLGPSNICLLSFSMETICPLFFFGGGGGGGVRCNVVVLECSVFQW